MKIAVNTRLLIKNKLDGIGWFTCETLQRITAQHPEHEFVFIFDRKFSDEFIFSSNIKPYIVSPEARHPFLFFWWFQYALPEILKKEKPDLFLSPDGFLPLCNRDGYSPFSFGVEQGMRLLPVIHDLNFEANPHDLPWMVRKYYRLFFPKFAKNATRIATVSEFSKNDIMNRYLVSSDKIDVVYNGSNENYKPIPDEIKIKTRQEFSNGKNYFLFTGTLHPRKNIANMLSAFDEFRKSVDTELKLVLVGNKLWWTDEMENIYVNMSFKKEVIFTGRLEPEHLGRVTASAFAILYVSMYEGFGIPILEAMNCDVPVITSNVTSMPEVAGEAAIYVNPYSAYSITAAMVKIYSDKKLRNGLVENGREQRKKFSWQKTSDKLWKSIEKTWHL